MDEQNEGHMSGGRRRRGHLLKASGAAAAVAGAIFAGSAQARVIEPDPGPGGPAVQSAQTATPRTTHKPKKADHHQRQRNRADTEKE